MKQRTLKLLSGIALAGVLTAASANAVTISTSGSFESGSKLVSGNADFTFSDNSVSITLRNLTQNPTGVVQLLNGLQFDIVGASLSGSLTRDITAPAGFATIASSGGTYTVAPNNLDRWSATGSGQSVTLTTLGGGNPDRLIIGPDSLGLFAGGSGLYNNANAGVIGDNPHVLGSVVANITIAGVTANSTLGNVTFRWGTSTDNTTTVINPGNEPTVPDSGTTLMLLGGALIGLVAVRRFLR